MNQQSFKNIFGVSPQTIQFIHYVYLLNSDFMHPKYILWTFSFLRNYEREGIAHLKFKKTNHRSFRNAVWATIYYLATQVDEVKKIF